MSQMYDYIIVEGIDGVGKTTICKKFQLEGYDYKHFNYDESCHDIKKKYMHDIFFNIRKKTVFDRSFISEYCYGNIYRQNSRISLSECIELFEFYKNKKILLIYVEASRNLILERRKTDFKLKLYIDDLLIKYQEIINIAKEYIDVCIVRGDKV